MTKILLILTTLFIGAGCSTTGQFKLPPDTKLMVTDRTATPDASGKWQTSPFFWDQTGGIKYRLVDGNGKVLRSGKLKSHFRVVSIFWPPVAIIYWPMGFMAGEFDLTRPGDGFMVVDDPMPPGAGTTSVMPAKSRVTDTTTPAPKKKKSKTPPPPPPAE